MKAQQSGFTLIELVMVIVIMGILAATALPKFVDLKADAAEAHADSVMGTVRSAAAMNYAKSLLDSTNTAITADAAGSAHLATLVDVDGAWAASAATFAATLSGTTYTITISAAESGTAPAVFTQSW